MDDFASTDFATILASLPRPPSLNPSSPSSSSHFAGADSSSSSCSPLSSATGGLPSEDELFRLMGGGDVDTAGCYDRSHPDLSEFSFEVHGGDEAGKQVQPDFPLGSWSFNDEQPAYRNPLGFRFVSSNTLGHHPVLDGLARC